MLQRLYIDFFKLPEKADIYLGNAVRCRPPGNRTPNKTQLKACHPFLLADVKRLQQEYKEVLILAVGGPACTATLGCSLRNALHQQGDFTHWNHLLKGDDVERPEPCRVFATYHPAYLQREASAGLAVKRHIQFLSDFLDGILDYEITDQLHVREAVLPPLFPIRRLSLDIETYGFVKGNPRQNYFHPLKSEKWDRVSKKKMVQTVGLSWRDQEGQLHHSIFYMDNVAHQRRLWAWFKKIKRDPEFEFLVGQNIVFDLLYLRHCYKEARVFLDDPLPVMDLMILNYLHDESRPEKSLKALAPLFRVTKYGEEFNKKKGEIVRFDTNRDPKLTQYNCQDTAATLRLAEKIEAEIRGFYGKDTKKLKPFCMKWYSQLLWLIVWMSETGIRMDEKSLTDVFNRYETAQNKITQHAKEAFGMVLRGKGSEKAKRAMMDDAVKFLNIWEMAVLELELTETKGLIKFSADNRNSLMSSLDPTTSHYKKLKLFGAYQDVSGMMDRYLYPLLVGGGKKHDKKDTVLLGGRSFPRWFPVPSQFEDETTGGTKQARIVAKGPPCQTFPPVIKATISNRFRDGWFIWFDYSQIELRVAALLSGDPVMMEEYMGKPDLHGATAKLMFGDDIVNHPQYKKLYRQAGKTFNFRALYRGGAKKAQVSLMKDLGIHLDLGRIGEIDMAFWKRHKTLRRWQDELMRHVQKYGYYELPLIGQSRLFLGGKKARERKLNEIVNLPVQAIAADIMLSAQYALWARFRQCHMKAVVPLNIYDAALIECPKHEIHSVRRIMDEILPSPPFYQALCDELGRTLPLEFDVEEKNVWA